ncbi:hypothetical protein K0B96_02485 [Horticoccus luteus]|uniref:Glycine zipper domain-containing protein n=1 Tax=Horticoccus luteus TaxID=2862869 RepID=A0A8F9TXE0_9BACT|nr:hypothetical protein [Horticoccus luteus]QYM79503.1 hypothetical protein K0B96_02485 [Horticoccus luteus]
MKTLLTLSLALGLFASADAQAFRPHWGHAGHGGAHYHGGAFHHGSHRGWARPSFSFYYSDHGWNPAPLYSYRYASAPVYVSSDYVSPAPSRAASGLFWGGLLGAIVGNNSGSLGHNAWRGAAYGAGAGLLLGALSDHAASEREAAAARTVSYVPTPSSPAPAIAAANVEDSAAVRDQTPDPAPRVRRRPASAMSSANSLFGRN